MLQELARVLMMADDERAFGLAYESLQLAEGLGLEAVRARNLNTIGCGKVKLGDQSGLEDLERAIEIGAAANSHEGVSAWRTSRRCRHPRGPATRRRAAGADPGRRSAPGGDELRTLARGGRQCCVLAGPLGRGARAVERLHRRNGAGSPHYMDSVCRYVRGSISLARGDIDAALADARRGTSRQGRQGSPGVNPAVAFEARVELSAGNLETASRLADELLAIWERTGWPAGRDSRWSLGPADLGRADELGRRSAGQAQTLWHQAARQSQPATQPGRRRSMRDRRAARRALRPPAGCRGLRAERAESGSRRRAGRHYTPSPGRRDRLAGRGRVPARRHGMIVCPSCGKETPEGFPRCAHCGARLPTRPSRPRGAQGRHGPLRRPRRLHVEGGAARPRGRAGDCSRPTTRACAQSSSGTAAPSRSSSATR